MSILLALVFGVLQGLRHAFEPDHVVALSTMLSEERRSRARIGYAAAWGTGHATTLLLVGGLLMMLRANLPPRLDAAFEVAVSVMLVGLGGRALSVAVREWRAHRGGKGLDSAAQPLSRRWRAIGPTAMGMVHGLAGSGALTALVVARLPSPTLGLLFIVLFGAGATAGMSLLAGVAGPALKRLLCTSWGMPALLATTGGVSLLLGAMWLIPAAHHLSVS